MSTHFRGTLGAHQPVVSEIYSVLLGACSVSSGAVTG